MRAGELQAMSLKELIRSEKLLKEEKAKKIEATKADLKRKIAEMAEDNGFTVHELFPNLKKGTRKKSAFASEPRYMNPTDRSQTWTGRGRKPGWLKEKVEKGEDLRSFAV